ncbi:MAG: HNH endonuclease signature motif containing protein, partial [Candidatus Rokuibacteriota bacterium]
MVLGRLAAVFLRQRGQQALGFARLDDYARERLGLSGREVQSLATVTQRAGALPAVTAAFAHGEISWAQLRLLVGVVTPDTQEQWLALARGRTVRALEALILRAEGPPDTDDSNDHARFRLPCPRRVKRLWHRAVELARRMAGASLSHGAAAEVIAAEGLSARTPPAEQWVPEPSPGMNTVDPDETTAAFAPGLDWAVLDDASTVDLNALLANHEALDAFVLDARMRTAVTALHQTAWQTGRLLRLFLDRRLFLAMGFRSASRYLRERLGLSERKARALVAVERRTWSAPAFGEAYREGRLSWVRALTVLPIVTEDTAGAWVDRAQAVSVRRLADEVEWALAGRVPCDPVVPPPLGARLDTSERQMCARLEWEPTDSDVVFRAPLEVIALFRNAIVAYSLPGEPLWRGLERLLEHVIEEWEAQPRHRDPVFARDGWRCTVPACSSRRNLHDHHVLFRSRGGDNACANRISVCAAHHLHGIHAGVVRAWGEAPD